jgi:cell wall-associated NlpC family hydrolase
MFLAMLFFVSLSQGQKVSGDSLANYSQTLLGLPYKYTAAGPSSFDCSGFVYYVFKQFGVSLPHSSSLLAKEGLAVSEDSCRPGDIIIFAGTKPGSTSPGHVGIVLGIRDSTVMFIHASSAKKHSGVVINSLASPGYRKRFIGIRRVIE